MEIEDEPDGTGNIINRWNSNRFNDTKWFKWNNIKKI
jgi:hypothetical protein